MSARASSGVTYDTTGALAFQGQQRGGSDGHGVFEVLVRCDTGTGNPALVRVRNSTDAESIHGTAEFAPLAIGATMTFRARDVSNLIQDVFIKGDGGDSDCSFTVIEV